MKRSKWKIIRLIWVISGIIFLAWLWNSSRAKGVNEEILQSSSAVKAEETKDLISFTPVHAFKKVFIFYPGALVDPVAYAPLCRKIADSGYKSIIIKMPWRLAKYGYNKPKEMGIFNDTSKQYVLAGHSQGAKMAAQFVSENPGLIQQLILLGSTHPVNIDLSHISIPVMKIYGTNDGVADTAGVNANKNKLPGATKCVLLKGANHSQFGFYGFQLGDHKAGISREEQQQLVFDNIAAFIRLAG